MVTRDISLHVEGGNSSSSSVDLLDFFKEKVSIGDCPVFNTSLMQERQLSGLSPRDSCLCSRHDIKQNFPRPFLVLGLLSFPYSK